MEGASTWTWGTVQRIARSLKIAVSRQITPTTQEMMLEAERVKSAEINYTELKRQLAERLAQPLQCPAQHPILPLELRLEMTSGHEAMLKVFPNMDGSPTSYLPVRLFFCGVCQEVYRERELELRAAEVQHASAC